MDFLWGLTIVIPQLPCLPRMAKAVSSTVELINSVTANSVNLYISAMWAFASKCFPIELVPCSDEWRRTCWQTIHKMPALPFSSIQHWNYYCHEGACFEVSQAIERFEPTFIDAQPASKMTCEVRSLESRIEIHSFLEAIKTSINMVLKDFEYNIAIRIWKLGNSTQEIGESYIIAM